MSALALLPALSLVFSLIAIEQPEATVMVQV
jgi:hypothetical protein